MGKFLKKLLGLLVTLAIIAMPLLVWISRNDIYDWYRLRNYTPPPAVVQLADATTMTDYARRLFYANRPHISERIEFNSACSKEASIVLGCYISGQGIYLFKIDDPRLSGVMEVTSAHEMLHAGYERLGSKDRAKIDDLTTQAFKSVQSTRVKETIERYRSQDASVVSNELHSIMATEVRSLPAELEEYYAKFFKNRSKLVDYSEKYESEFSKRQETVQEYDRQLQQLKISIDAHKNELSLQHDALIREKERLEGLLVAGNVAAYNSAAGPFNSQVNGYNSLVRTTDSEINQFNAIVEKRNNLAVEVQDLVQAIDSRPQRF